MSKLLNANRCLAVAVASLLMAPALHGTSTLKMNLQLLVQKSGRIVAGKCVAVEYAVLNVAGGGKIPFTRYTFLVSKAVKGNVSSRLEIRMVGGRKNGGVLHIQGMPAYAVGEEYVLLLTSESSLGFTAPVGLQQGVFRVTGTGKGRKRNVINGFGNAGLLDEMEIDQPNINGSALPPAASIGASGESGIDYEAFLALLEKLVVR